MTDDDPLALDIRTGWPADLAARLARHPRESWYPEAARSARGDLSETTRFWLARHDMFRELGDALQAAEAARRDGSVDAACFRAWFAPRLGFFLRELETHHRVEDHHYFPAFAAAAPDLARGFETLDGDHHRIHESLAATAAAGRALLDALARDDDAARLAADGYGAAADALLKRLRRHLGDEEDLIVPLLIERPDAEPAH